MQTGWVQVRTLSRRVFNRSCVQLLGSVVVVSASGLSLSACTDQNATSTDEQLVNDIIGQKSELIHRIDSALADQTQDPVLRRRLTAIKRNHQDHITVLDEFTSSATDNTSDSAIISSSPSVAQIMKDSQQAAAARLTQLTHTEDAHLIRALCLIGACEAVHEEMLQPYV